MTPAIPQHITISPRLPRQLRYSPPSRALTPMSAGNVPNGLTDQNHFQSPLPQNMASNAPSSQLAWLSSLQTSFNDFTPEQKFLRKVRTAAHKSCLESSSDILE